MLCIMRTTISLSEHLTNEDVVAEHREYARWLTRMATGPEPFALAVLVLAGFVRIATNSRIFNPPATLETAFDEAEP